MWAYVKDDTVQQTNSVQTRLEINPGVFFQQKYANEWTKEQKEAAGIYEIEDDRTNYKDPEYYTNGADTISFGSGKVTRVWASATAKSLVDVNFTQADEDAGRGTKDELNYRGLTYQHKQLISNQAHSLLTSTDWYASRKAEAGTAIPTTVANFRAAVRTKAADMHTKIDAADTTAKLMALYVRNDSGERPLGDWPDAVE